MKHRVSNLVLATAAVISLLGLYSFMNLFSPESAGPWGILAVFSMTYVASFSSLLLVVRAAGSVYAAFRLQSSISQVKRDKMQIYSRRSVFIVAALSMMPIFLMSLNSIGNLSFVDVALIISIEFLLIFYILKRT